MALYSLIRAFCGFRRIEIKKKKIFQVLMLDLLVPNIKATVSRNKDQIPSNMSCVTKRFIFGAFNKAWDKPFFAVNEEGSKLYM